MLFSLTVLSPSGPSRQRWLLLEDSRCSSCSVSGFLIVPADREGEVDACPLCRACSGILVTLPSAYTRRWPPMTALQVEDVWFAARDERRRNQASALARVQDVGANTVESLIASLEKALAEKSLESARKVA